MQGRMEGIAAARAVETESQFPSLSSYSDGADCCRAYRQRIKTVCVLLAPVVGLLSLRYWIPAELKVDDVIMSACSPDTNNRSSTLRPQQVTVG